MKKYGKLIILSLFIVSTISVFYITGLLNEKKLPQFEIHTVSGDEKIVDNLVVKGRFGTTMFNEDSFRTEDGRTTYGRNTSFINHDKFYYNDKQFNDLQEKHRNFMRGKANNLHAFYENDEKLIYGNITYDHFGVGTDYKFEVDVLDKKTNKRLSSFTHHIPNRHDYWSIELVHTQLVNDELKMITINDRTSGDNSQEAYVYTFDINEKKLISEEIITSFKRDKHNDSYEYMTVINKENPHDSEVTIYMKQVAHIYSDENRVSDYEERAVTDKIVVYDLIDKTIDEIDLLKEFENVAHPFYTDEDSLYLGKTLINKLSIEKYNLKEGKITETIEIDTNISDVDQDNIVYSNVIDGQLYYVPLYDIQYTEKPSVIIVDLVNMESTYEGFLQLTDRVITEDMYLYLDSLEKK